MGVLDNKDYEKLVKLKLLIAEVNDLLYKKIDRVKFDKAPVNAGAKVIKPGSPSKWTKLDSFLTVPGKSHLQWARFACRDTETILLKGKTKTLGDLDALADLKKDIEVIHMGSSPIHKSIITRTDRQIANTLWKYYNKLLNKLHKITGIDTKIDHFGHWRIQIRNFVNADSIYPNDRFASGWNLVKTDVEVDVLNKIDKKDQHRDAMEDLDEALDTYSRIWQLKSK
jgi:hypothetical protein